MANRQQNQKRGQPPEKREGPAPALAPGDSVDVALQGKIRVERDNQGMFSSISAPSLSRVQQQQQQQQPHDLQLLQQQQQEEGQLMQRRLSTDPDMVLGGQLQPPPSKVTREEVMSLNSIVIGGGGGSGKQSATATRVQSAGAAHAHGNANMQAAISKSVKAGRLERVPQGPLRTMSGHTGGGMPAVTVSSSVGSQELQRAAALQRINSRIPVIEQQMAAAAAAAAAASGQGQGPGPAATSVAKIMGYGTRGSRHSQDGLGAPTPQLPGAGHGGSASGGGSGSGTGAAADSAVAAAGVGRGEGGSSSQSQLGSLESLSLAKTSSDKAAIRRERTKDRSSFSETFPKARAAGAEDHVAAASGSGSGAGAFPTFRRDASVAPPTDLALGGATAEGPGPGGGGLSHRNMQNAFLSTTGGGLHPRVQTSTVINAEAGVMMVGVSGSPGSPKIFVPPISIEAIADKDYAHSYAAPTLTNTSALTKDEARARENDRVINERLLEAKALDRNKKTASGATMHTFSLWSNAKKTAAAVPSGVQIAPMAVAVTADTGNGGGGNSAAVVPSSSSLSASAVASASIAKVNSARSRVEVSDRNLAASTAATAIATATAAVVLPPPLTDTDKTPQMSHGRKYRGSAVPDGQGVGSNSGSDSVQLGTGSSGKGGGRVASSLRNLVGSAKTQQLQYSPSKPEDASHSANAAAAADNGSGLAYIEKPAGNATNVNLRGAFDKLAAQKGADNDEVSDTAPMAARSDDSGSYIGEEQMHVSPSFADRVQTHDSEDGGRVQAGVAGVGANVNSISQGQATFDNSQFGLVRRTANGGIRGPGVESESDAASGMQRPAAIRMQPLHGLSSTAVTASNQSPGLGLGPGPANDDPDSLQPLTERSTGTNGPIDDEADGGRSGGNSHSDNGGSGSGRLNAASPTMSELSHGSDDEAAGGGGGNADRAAMQQSRKSCDVPSSFVRSGPPPAREHIIFHDAPTTPLRSIIGGLSVNVNTALQSTPLSGTANGPRSEAGAASAEAAGQVQAYSPLRWKRGALIGEGTFGKVYKGMNERTGELLAVKQLSLIDGSSEDVEGLQKEISVMWHLDHPNIVRYLGTARSERYLFIVIEYVSGGSIANMLQQFGPFVEKLIRRFTLHILSGVQYLHERGIIHRDIKGANVLVTNGGVAKLADFGCSKQLVGMCTASMDESMKAIRGSVPWMAPEVIKQSGHGRSSDVWGIGATVIEMGTGKPPWPEFTNNLAALFHVATSKNPPPAPAHLSKSCANFLSRCMQIEPSQRATAAQLLATDPFILSTSPNAHSIEANIFQLPPGSEEQPGGSESAGLVGEDGLRLLVTPRTDMLESAKVAFKNSVAVSELLFPDHFTDADDDGQLSVASSFCLDTPAKAAANGAA